MIKKERKKYGLLPPTIAESDTMSLGHGLCGSGGSMYNKTPAKTHSLLALTMIDPATGWFEIVEATNKSATSIQDFIFITPGWNVTRKLNLLSLTVEANSNVSSNKCVTIMALKPNQLQVTTYHQQSNATIE
jgi:hypothetical protein